MATCASSCSRWGILNEIGITEDDLLNILVRGDCSAVNKLHGDIPTYGLVIELFYFADEVAESLHRRPNRILKCLLDTLYPQFSISRADRLERRVRTLCAPLERMAKEEMDEYLRNKWMPQPTGKLLFGVCILHVYHFISIVMLMFAYVLT